MDESELHDLIDQAVAALGEGDYVRAVAIGDQLVAAAPDRAAVRAIRAEALLGADAPEESFSEARQAVELAPRDERSQLLLALAAWRTQRLSLAQESFGRAIELSGRSSATLSEYAWFMATERGPKLGERAAREAIAADAASSTAWAALGLAQYRQHRRQEAEASLRRALELNPRDIYAQSAMVALLQDRHEDRSAEALVGLLEEHPGTEELVSAVRDEAKRRQIARILVERKADVEEMVSQSRSYHWIWLLGGGGLIALFSALLNPWYPVAVIALTLFLLVMLHRWLD
jgi:Tfp pilus assembly protein PilF